MKIMSENNEYSTFGIFPWHFSAILLITAITLLISSGITSLNQDVGFIFLLAMFWFLTIAGWMNFLFRRVVVTEEGVVYRRTLKVRLGIIYTSDWYFPFESMEKIRVKGKIARFKYRKRSAKPSLVIVKDSKGFVEAVRKYAPDKVE